MGELERRAGDVGPHSPERVGEGRGRVCLSARGAVVGDRVGSRDLEARQKAPRRSPVLRREEHAVDDMVVPLIDDQDRYARPRGAAYGSAEVPLLLCLLLTRGCIAILRHWRSTRRRCERQPGKNHERTDANALHGRSPFHAPHDPRSVNAGRLAVTAFCSPGFATGPSQSLAPKAHRLTTRRQTNRDATVPHPAHSRSEWKSLEMRVA